MRKIFQTLVASTATLMPMGGQDSLRADPAFAFIVPPPPAHAGFCADQEAMFKARVAFIEAKLDLQSTQRSGWDAFVAELRAAEEPLRRLCAERAAAEPQTAVASLESGQRRLESLLQTHTAMVAATKKLAPSLTADQQATLARALLPPPHFPPRPPVP